MTGAIRPGLAADLVAVEGDPIADADGPGGHAGLGGLRRVRDVIQGGRPVVRDGQRAGLSRASRSVRPRPCGRPR